MNPCRHKRKFTRLVERFPREGHIKYDNQTVPYDDLTTEEKIAAIEQFELKTSGFFTKPCAKDKCPDWEYEQTPIGFLCIWPYDEVVIDEWDEKMKIYKENNS